MQSIKKHYFCRKIATGMKHRIFVLCAILAMVIGAWAQSGNGGTRSYRQFVTPTLDVTPGFDVDFNKQVVSGSLAVSATMGEAGDLMNISLGLGYRGFWDMKPPVEFLRHPSVSDFLLYTKSSYYDRRNEVRPMGGEFIIPAELHINALRITDDDWMLFVGIACELGLSVYQSNRYRDHYGTKIMRSSAFSFSPRIGISGDEGAFSIYWRHYASNCFNDRDFAGFDFASKNHFGLQLTFRIDALD